MEGIVGMIYTYMRCLFYVLVPQSNGFCPSMILPTSEVPYPSWSKERSIPRGDAEDKMKSAGPSRAAAAAISPPIPLREKIDAKLVQSPPTCKTSYDLQWHFSCVRIPCFLS